MPVKFANYLSTSLVLPITAAQTTITVNSTAGMPAVAGGNHFYLTIIDQVSAANGTNPPAQREIVKVTGISGQVLTVARGQDGTMAQAFAGGAAVELRPNAAALEELAGPMFDITTYGAVGDGVTDCAAAIQNAINAASAAGGGVVFIPGGVFVIKSGLTHMPGVSYLGTAAYITGGIGPINGSIILWKPDVDTSGVMLTMVNVPTVGCAIRNVTFERFSGHIMSVTGLLAGSTVANYFTTLLKIDSCTFRNLSFGLRDNGAADISLFDWQCTNTWFTGCGIGAQLFGSGTYMEECKFSTCSIAGVQLRQLSAYSLAGVQFVSCTWISNQFDINVPTTVTTLRPCSWHACWFEGSISGIVRIQDPSTDILNWTFTSCMFSTSNLTTMFDVTNAWGQIVIRDCVSISGGVGTAQNFVGPSSAQGRLITENVVIYSAALARTYKDDWVNFTPTITNTGGGGFTTTVQTAKYCLRGGNVCHVILVFTVTNAGSGGNVNVTMPFTPAADSGAMIGGEQTSGLGIHGPVQATGAQLKTAANGATAVLNYKIYVEGTYRIA